MSKLEACLKHDEMIGTRNEMVFLLFLLAERSIQFQRQQLQQQRFEQASIPIHEPADHRGFIGGLGQGSFSGQGRGGGRSTPFEHRLLEHRRGIRPGFRKAEEDQIPEAEVILNQGRQRTGRRLLCRDQIARVK